MIRVPWLTSLLAAGGIAQGASQPVYPPLDNPKLRFENRNQPTAGIPPLPGPSATWRVAQWLNPEKLEPARFGPAGPQLPGPAAGTLVASVATPDAHSAVAVYRGADGMVFRLRAQDGQHEAGGSSNLFLTASPLVATARFDRVITYDLRARLAEAAITASPEAVTDGRVLAHVFTGFTVHLHGVAGAPNYDLFLQIAHAASRDEAPGYFQCVVRNGGRGVTLGWGGTLPGAPWLPFRPDPGPLRPLHYVLNDYLCAVLATPPPCRGPGGTPLVFAPAARDPARWRLGGIYLGIETHNRDAAAAAQGHVTVALDIADVAVRRLARRAAPCAAK